MKVDRRSFLGLGLGAAAGVALSPVGIKLTDDSSIWSQNWPWTPVPADGLTSYENSVCSLCPGKCGISVRKIDNRPVKIEGQEEYPVNNGGICLHGISGLQYLYDPSRVKTPLKKNGDKFEEISWKDAITLVAGKLADIRNAGNPDKLACISGDDKGAIPGLFKRFLTAYGSANFYTMPSLDKSLEITMSGMHGEGTTAGYDLENADFILSFGAGIIDGWGSPVNFIQANASRKERHAKLYQIESRLSNTAASADKWIPAKPGSEADLALSICSVIIKNNLFDSSYSYYFKNGFNKFAAMVQDKYSPDKASEVTGIAAPVIEQIAKDFVNAKSPVAVCGRGKGINSASLKEFAAVHALNCLAGNINQKGGVFVLPVFDYLQFSDEVMDETAQSGIEKGMLADSINDFFTKIKATTKPEMDALFVYNANPCFSLHDSNYIQEVFKKIPFIVSFSSYLDETSQYADVILPSHTNLEMFQDLPATGGIAKQIVGLSKPVAKTVFNTKNPGDSIIELAAVLKGSIAESFAWDNFEACLEDIASDIWDSLSEEGYAIVSDQVPSERPNVNFSFLANNPDTVTIEGDKNDFPLTLIEVDKIRIASTAPASSPFAIKTVSDKVILGKDVLVEI